MESTKKAYQKLIQKISVLKQNKEGQIDFNKVKQYQEAFQSALEDDLNTANAITILYDVIKDDSTTNTKLHLIESFDTVLSLNLLQDQSIHEDLELYIQQKIQERKEAKQNHNYVLADQIRTELSIQGIELKDTREGTTYTIKR